VYWELVLLPSTQPLGFCPEPGDSPVGSWPRGPSAFLIYTFGDPGFPHLPFPHFACLVGCFHFRSGPPMPEGYPGSRWYFWLRGRIHQTFIIGRIRPNFPLILLCRRVLADIGPGPLACGFCSRIFFTREWLPKLAPLASLAGPLSVSLVSPVMCRCLVPSRAFWFSPDLPGPANAGA